jgi:hypothetical protein
VLDEISAVLSYLPVIDVSVGHGFPLPVSITGSKKTIIQNPASSQVRMRGIRAFSPACLECQKISYARWKVL